MWVAIGFLSVIVVYSFYKWLKEPRCFKTERGYNCHHRVYEDGTKECGP